MIINCPNCNNKFEIKEVEEKKDFHIIIDAGHGGLDDNGNYTTAPSKMYDFGNGKIAYEGVYNRYIANYLSKELDLLNIENSFTVDPSNSNDISLNDRVSYANKKSDEIGKNKVFLISIHNNAGKGKGFEVFSYYGQTESDILAKNIYDNIGQSNYTRRLRGVKEANYMVLRETKCSAVLLEYEFFDEEGGYELLENDDFLRDMAKYTAKGINEYLSK